MLEGTPSVGFAIAGRSKVGERHTALTRDRGRRVGRVTPFQREFPVPTWGYCGTIYTGSIVSTNAAVFQFHSRLSSDLGLVGSCSITVCAVYLQWWTHTPAPPLHCGPSRVCDEDGQSHFLYPRGLVEAHPVHALQQLRAPACMHHTAKCTAAQQSAATRTQRSRALVHRATLTVSSPRSS